MYSLRLPANTSPVEHLTAHFTRTINAGHVVLDSGPCAEGHSDLYLLVQRPDGSVTLAVAAYEEVMKDENGFNLACRTLWSELDNPEKITPPAGFLQRLSPLPDEPASARPLVSRLHALDRSADPLERQEADGLWQKLVVIDTHARSRWYRRTVQTHLAQVAR